jgi:hypothetical protein
MDVQVAMLTGDSKPVAGAVAKGGVFRRRDGNG